MERNLVIPSHLDHDAKDIIDKLLARDPHQRLGCGDPGTLNDLESAKKHPFFKKVKWQCLSALTPPVPMHKLSDNMKFQSPPKLHPNK